MRDSSQSGMASSLRSASVGGLLSRFRRRGQGCWGDGLADQSLATLHYPASWSTVDRDELVFLLPSLTDPSSSGQPAGVAPFFLEALAEWSGIEPTAPTADADRVLRIGSILDTLYRRALRSAPAPAGQPAEPLAPRDAVAGAIHSRIHPAYADPALAYLHETLTVAAWLGHLVCGRDAYLPPVIAAPLLQLLDEGSPATGRGGDDVAGQIVRYSAAAGGARHLAGLAVRVVRTGQPRRIRSTVGGEPWTLADAAPSVERARRESGAAGPAQAILGG